MADRAHTALERAFLTLLRPLVRLLLARGVAYGELAELVKRAYVEVAASDFAVEGRKPSISHIAVLTGLTRKEASRLTGSRPDREGRDVSSRYNRAARVLTAWARESRFANKRGGPASLPFESDSGPSFSELVRGHGADVPARAVLDELERVGAVECLRDGRIRPVDRVYVPHSDDEQKLAILGTDVANLVSCIDHNLGAPAEDTFFQRKVAYDNLPADYLPALRRLVHRDGQALLERLDRDMSRRDRDVSGRNNGGLRKRAVIGIHYFEEDHHEEE
jgi:hypothetical protein